MRTAFLVLALLASRGSVPASAERMDRWETGEVKARTPLSDGRADGVARAWYRDGRPMWNRAFRAGRERGLHEGWWPKGSKKFSFIYDNGVLEGVAYEWYEDGRLFREATYRHGQEEGPQRMWDADGALRASYEVRDGRRYGSIGAMGCTPK